MEDHQIISLFKSYHAGNLAGAELDMFEQWALNVSLDEFVRLSRLALPAYAEGQLTLHRKLQLKAALDAVDMQERVVPMRMRWGWAAAAIVLLSLGVYWYQSKPAQTTAVKTEWQDVAPGRYGAILTLSDSTQLVLDSLGD